MGCNSQFHHSSWPFIIVHEGDRKTIISKFTFVFNQAHGQTPQTGGVQYAPETLEQHNQVQSLLPEPHRHQRRWSHTQHRSVGVLPQPEPEEETKPFILDLKNFPDLANADVNSQNPNIQVSGMRDVANDCMLVDV